MNNKKTISLTLSIIALSILSTACSNGGGGGGGNSSTNNQLVLIGPSIIPSLPGIKGINYIGVYNSTNTAINNINYSLSQQVGSGSSIKLDNQSATNCANISAQSSCYLKVSVPESALAGGALITANNATATTANPLAIGVQQIYYNESSGADGIGLYFYPKVQYSTDGAPYMIVTAVIQSPNVTNINTIQLVDQNGNLISGRQIISKNSGPGKSPLATGNVVAITLPIPQGTNLSQIIKVQASYQTLTSAMFDGIKRKLDLERSNLKNTTNSNIGTASYSLTTQGNDINLQLTPNQIYLTESNPIQYGYLSNIGNLTATQIQLGSASQNVNVTTSTTSLNGQTAIQVAYKLINTRTYALTACMLL